VHGKMPYMNHPRYIYGDAINEIGSRNDLMETLLKSLIKILNAMIPAARQIPPKNKEFISFSLQSKNKNLNPLLISYTYDNLLRNPFAMQSIVLMVREVHPFDMLREPP
jgi:hypothetical protein